MNDKKRISINIIAQVVSFLVQFLINFFLTPFIVEKLGTEAYGYIGLANNFILYAQLVTVALNSMASRYIAISYHRGEISKANQYFSSVFCANLIITLVLLLIGCVIVFFLEDLIQIPLALIYDVKCLFLLIICNFLISVLFSTFQVATFIKNRLDLIAIRNMASNFIRIVVIAIAFLYFEPKLLYIGLASIICGIYISIYNIIYSKTLTPDLILSFRNYNWKRIIEIISSGIWNTVSKLSSILNQGFDLLFANLFVGPVAMGILSITKQVPIFVVGFINSIATVFAPSLTKMYAQGDKESFNHSVLSSVRLTGVVALMPLSFLFVFSDIFYKLWIPTSDYDYLYLLTVIGILHLPFVLALEGTQNVFPITDRVKGYAVISLIFNIVAFLSIVICLYYCPGEYRLLCMVCISCFWNLCKAGVFLPLYAANCMGVRWYFFYKDILKVLLSCILSVSLLLPIKSLLIIDSWLMLSFCILITICVSCSISLFTIAKQSDRSVIYGLIKKYTNVAN